MLAILNKLHTMIIEKYYLGNYTYQIYEILDK